jgi:hypothetical protein
MPTFAIEWSRLASHQWSKHKSGAPNDAPADWIIEATLVERAIVGHKPALWIVCGGSAACDPSRT